MAVGRGDEAPGHVVAEERDGRGIAAFLTLSSPPVLRLLGIGERRLRAEGDFRQIDAARGKVAPSLSSTLPPLGTVGSVIVTVPPVPAVMWKFQVT